MATNLLIGYCDIPNRATSVTLSQTESTSEPYRNLFGGNRTDRFSLASAYSGNLRATFSSVSGPCDFLYIARANLLQKNGVTALSLKGGATSTYASATTLYSTATFASSLLWGPESEDFIVTFPEGSSSTFQHWWVDYTSSSSSLFPHAKLFFGKAFEHGVDPNDVMRVSRIATGGSKRRATYAFNLKWNGMAYAKAVKLYQDVSYKRRHLPVVLFTKSFYGILFEHGTLFGRITEVSMPPRATDYCDVTIRFEEMV